MVKVRNIETGEFMRLDLDYVKTLTEAAEKKKPKRFVRKKTAQEKRKPKSFKPKPETAVEAVEDDAA